MDRAITRKIQAMQKVGLGVTEVQDAGHHVSYIHTISRVAEYE